MKGWRRWLRPGRVVLLLLLIGLVVLLLNFQLHQIQGVSMLPAFADEAWMIVRRDPTPPIRYEAVVMRSSGSDAKSVIKRAVAFGGESVLIREGDLLVDGKFVPRTAAQIRSTLVPWLRIEDLALRGRGRRKTLVGRTEETALEPLLGRCELSESGRFLRVAPDEGASRARLRIPAADIRDDHVSPKGRWVRGEEIVRDLEVTLGFYEVAPGSRLRIAHHLQGDGEGQAETVWVERQVAAWRFRVEAHDGRVLYEATEKRAADLGVRITWIDDRCRLEVRPAKSDTPWDTLFSGDRLREGRVEASFLTLELEGDAVVLERLDILRDIHYTSPQTDTPYGVTEPFEVPRGQVFVLGDNSPESRDSRHWGALEIADSVLGRPVFTIWPKSRWGILRSARED